MAGEGILTALQAALSGLGGGIEAAQQYRAYEQKRKREEDIFNYQRQRDVLQDVRQKDIDAARLRQEELDAVKSGMVSADRFAGMTMPGATPMASMQPTLRQTIGGKEYVYSPEVARAEAHRSAIEQSKMAQSIKRAEQSYADKDLATVAEEARIGGRNSVAAAKLAARSKSAFEAMFPEPQRATPLDMLRQEETLRERDLQNAQGMKFLSDNRKNQSVIDAYSAIATQNKKLSPGQIGYAIMQQGLSESLAAQRSASAEASTARADATKAKGAGRVPSAPPPGFTPDALNATPEAKQPTAEELRVQREKERLRKMYPQLDTMMRR